MDLATILNWLQAIFSDPQWVGAIGTWFAGFCTLAAVLVSLWLAYDRNRVKLKVSASAAFEMHSNPGLPFGMQASGKAQEIAWIRATNIGLVPVHIAVAGFRVGRGKKRKEIALLEPSKQIQPGEDTSFKQPIDELAGMLAAKSYGEEDIKRLKAVVATTVGKPSVVKVEQSLVDALTQRIRQKEKSHA